MLLDDLEIIVIKTDEAEAEGDQDQHPDVGIVQFRPEEGGGQGGEDDHQAAHGGGAVFGKWDLGPSSRTVWLTCMALSFLMNQEPTAREMIKAVSTAKMVRKVIYRKTLKPPKTVFSGYSRWYSN